MSHQATVSVVIVNYNSGDALRQCVSALMNDQQDIQIIVVDNDSSDDSIELLVNAFPVHPSILINRNDLNLGFATACNLGAALANGKQLLYLNPDTEVEPDCIATLMNTLEAHSDAGMVGGLIVNPDGSEQAGCRRSMPTPWSALVKVTGLSKIKWIKNRWLSDFSNTQQPLPEQVIDVEAISGACMLVRRAALEQVGGFDEAYFLHCEDLDWCMRFGRAGWRILFEPKARLLHKQGTCSRRRPVFVEWHKHRGMIRFYHKFYRNQYSAVLLMMVTMAVWFRFLLVAGILSLRRLLLNQR